MSGPKYSKGEIEARRLLRLLAQLEKEVEREQRRIALAELNTKIQLLEELCAEYNALGSQETLSKIAGIPVDRLLVAELERLQSLGSKTCAFKANTKGDSKALLSVITSVDSKIEVLTKLIPRTKKLVVTLDTEYKSVVTDMRETDFKNKRHDVESISPFRGSKDLRQVHDELIELMLVSNASEDALKGVDSLMNNHNVDGQYKLKELANRLSAIRVDLNANPAFHEAQQLRNECQALFVLIGKSEAQIPVSLDDLRTLKEALTTELRKRATSDYIASSMKEVMSNAGYNVLSTESLTKTMEPTERCLYDVSEDSVLNVSTSESGAIMFEVMARKKGEAVTQTQRSVVKHDMDRFCPDYALIKTELSKRGVLLTAESLHEADEKYVRAIEVIPSTSVSRRAGKRKASDKEYING